MFPQIVKGFISMSLKNNVLAGVIIAGVALIVGCGASKSYVNEQLKASDDRHKAELAAVEQKTAADIARLQSLSDELSRKTDMAISDAKGFEDYTVIWKGEINFAFDSDDISATAAQILTKGAEKMAASPRSLMEIAGHTDQSGSSKYNTQLGERRANSAKTHLAESGGIALYRLFIVSYGETKPLLTGDQKNTATKNRRVTLKVWGPAS
jgi:outer membrane protein OmpA-like peptidoglycan-associated protein